MRSRFANKCIYSCLHAKLISSFIGKYTENSAFLKMKSAGMRVMAFLFALLIVKSSFSSMADAVSLLPSADRDQTDFCSGCGRHCSLMSPRCGK